MASRQPIAVIALAGGRGSRLGGDKALLMRDGAPVLAGLVGLADEAPALVVRPSELPAPELGGVSCEFIPDQVGGGPAAALVVGLRALVQRLEPESLARSRVLIVAADIVGLTRAHVRRMAEVLDGSPADGAVWNQQGRPHWLCGLWNLAALLDLRQQQRSFVGESVGSVFEGLELALVDLSEVADVDWPSDAEAAGVMLRAMSAGMQEPTRYEG